MKKIKIKVKKPLVFVPMSADILHKGHINILKRAKKFGSVIVGLMTDKGIVSYKKKKPLFKYKDRKSLLMSLRYVDQVIPI
jgi:cytidyltransferase-like protein